MLTHPTLDQLRALMLEGLAQAFVELEAQEEVRNLAHAEWLALLLDREAVNRNTRRFQTRLRVARLRHSQPRSRTSTTARPVGSTRRCSSSWPPAAGSPTTAIFWSPVRAVSASRGYPVHSRRKPAATATRSLRPCAALVCR
jgi:hypothetical protein